MNPITNESYIIKNAQVINEGKTEYLDVWVHKGRIRKVGHEIETGSKTKEINADGLYLMPGIIDDQVHFREPGLLHKGRIFTESKAAVAGGVTSFMEMPNTDPPILTQELLEWKHMVGSKNSVANYSFYMGVSNDNYDEVMSTNPNMVCGIKIFMGSSTGNMLVDDTKVLEKIFDRKKMLIATHCEDEEIIEMNSDFAYQEYGHNVPPEYHPKIRTEKACYRSSKFAVELATKCKTRLHILHITTEKELSLFTNEIDLEDKLITSEACVHHLYFDASDYAQHGFNIKCNPAIKEARHKEAVLKAVLDDRIDVIATDHAPHTSREKESSYFSAPSGLPLVQHGFNIMLSLHQEGKISLEKIVEKMCHAPARCFQLSERGYIREGYWADLVLFDPNYRWMVNKDNIEYLCKWSPFEGHFFTGRVLQTFVSGHLVYDRGKIYTNYAGQRLEFDRSWAG